MRSSSRIELPLHRPLQTAHGSIYRRQGVVLFDESGAVAEMTPHPDVTSTDPEVLFQAVTEGDRTVPSAAAALEWFEFDRRARDRGVPVAHLLADDVAQDRVPVNGLVGADAGVEDVLRLVRLGFRTVKVKLSGSPDCEMERLVAIRSAVGPDVSLRADAGGVWSNVEAVRVLEALAGAGLEYVEDPIDPEADWGVLSGSPVPLAADTMAPSSSVLDVADVIVVKPSTTGPLEAMQLIAASRDHGCDVVVTSIIDGAIGVAAALQVAVASETARACGLATSEFLAADVADSPPIRDGSMSLGRPGVGVVLDVEQLAQVAVTSFSNVSNG